MNETVVLCEGYHDRAFWQGLLAYLNCIDPGATTGSSTRRKPVFDPHGLKVDGGDFAYHSPNQQFIRIRPCKGKSNIRRLATERLREIPTKPLVRLVVCVDADNDDPTLAGKAMRQSIESGIQHASISFEKDPLGDLLLTDSDATVSFAIWSHDAAQQLVGVPAKQTLERVVCAALATAYPERAAAVADWLAKRPSPPPDNGKEHAWSFMAGWSAEFGCDTFYTKLWLDNNVVRQLTPILSANGVWRIAQEIAR